MPLPLAAKAGFIAISVAVVAAIAVYESPELRRIADDLRRRIAIAIQAIGENISPDGVDEQQRQRQQNGEPVFNRPEDAEGFMLSRGRHSNEDPGVDADEASRRRQREELLYWNRLQIDRKKEQLRKLNEALQSQSQDQNQNQTQARSPAAGPSWQPREALEALQRSTRNAAAAAGIYLPSLGGPESQPRSKTSFDQFMRPDHNADRNTFVVNTGVNLSNSEVEDPLSSGLLRRRRPEGVRGLNTAAIYSNPFGDEYGIELDDQRTTGSSSGGAEGPSAAEAFNSGTAYLIAPDRDEAMSDIYSATEPDTNGPPAANGGSNNNYMDAVFDPLPAIPGAARSTRTVSEVPTSEVFFDVNNDDSASPATLAAADIDSQLSLRLFRVLEDRYSTKEGPLAEQEQQQQEEVNTEAYNSIQAWAQNSSGPGFYSPLPVTPSVGMSEPSVISAGELTPTGSMSVCGDAHSVIDHADAVSEAGEAPSSSPQATAGSTTSATATAITIAHVTTAPVVVETPAPAAAAPQAVEGSDYGVISEDDEDDAESVMTPTSWSEVGSVVSESSDAATQPMHA